MGRHFRQLPEQRRVARKVYGVGIMLREEQPKPQFAPLNGLHELGLILLERYQRLHPRPRAPDQFVAAHRWGAREHRNKLLGDNPVGDQSLESLLAVGYLSIQYAEESVTLRVTDNGKGFEVPNSPAEFAPGGHFGLLGLHERAELIGAQLEIRSSPGKGAQLTIELPSARKTAAINTDEQAGPETTR